MIADGHRRPESGTVFYKNRKLSAYPRRELSREMALVPQNFYIDFPFTAREIVLMGRYPHIPRFSAPCAKDLAAVDEIMARTGTAAFSSVLLRKSGGERQRWFLVRGTGVHRTHPAHARRGHIQSG
ncbi:MAG: ABC transporter ATP-binding protein [Desulfobacterales bacterium]